MSARDVDLFRLVYRSRSAIGTRAGPALDAEAERRAVAAIVHTSERRNAQSGVTGALMFTGLHFVQALEGSAAAVEATFDRICCDLRHTGVEVLECGPVLETAFGDWSMSHLVPDAGVGTALDQAEETGDLVDAAARAMKLMMMLIRSRQDGVADAAAPPAQRAGSSGRASGTLRGV